MIFSFSSSIRPIIVSDIGDCCPVFFESGRALTTLTTLFFSIYTSRLAIAVAPWEFESISTHQWPLGWPLPIYLSFMMVTDIASPNSVNSLRSSFRSFRAIGCPHRYSGYSLLSNKGNFGAFTALSAGRGEHLAWSSIAAVAVAL